MDYKISKQGESTLIVFNDSVLIDFPGKLNEQKYCSFVMEQLREILPEHSFNFDAFKENVFSNVNKKQRITVARELFFVYGNGLQRGISKSFEDYGEKNKPMLINGLAIKTMLVPTNSKKSLENILTPLSNERAGSDLMVVGENPTYHSKELEATAYKIVAEMLFKNIDFYDKKTNPFQLIKKLGENNTFQYEDGTIAMFIHNPTKNRLLEAASEFRKEIDFMRKNKKGLNYAASLIYGALSLELPSFENKGANAKSVKAISTPEIEQLKIHSEHIDGIINKMITEAYNTITNISVEGPKTRIGYYHV
ncbi:MAG: hypothetical protein Q8O89_05805 [Nanoarchaeota archaeon]|nr:hypothetical protein [Nanoarchaeota archaeon]